MTLYEVKPTSVDVVEGGMLDKILQQKGTTYTVQFQTHVETPEVKP